MIMEAFNTAHISTIVIIPAAVYIILYYSLRKREEAAARKVLLLICCFNILLYLSYKIVQSQDPDYGFNIFTNLPLHFCNINLFLLPLAIYTKNKYLMAYQFYFGTILAALALVTIDPVFRSKPLFEFTCIVYFYYHSMLAVIPVLLIKLKFFVPSFKAVWQPIAMIIGLTFTMHVVNIIFRTTGLAVESNYFFTYGLRGDFFTEIYWSILPYEFFFLLPSLLSFLPFIFFTTLPFHLAEKRQARLKF
ncbi:MAG: YwaF family protein [Clostridiales bacterium]|jgi:uncharacterized membrane protein YwaF|nr:YwaF family protein [Clostridiales bacterium]